MGWQIRMNCQKLLNDCLNDNSPERNIMKKLVQICFEFEDVKLGQTSNKLFTVIYGQQITEGLTYEKACTELGACLMHQAACNSLLDNTGK